MTDKQLKNKIAKAQRLAKELQRTVFDIGDEFQERGDEKLYDDYNYHALDLGELISTSEYQKGIL